MFITWLLHMLKNKNETLKIVTFQQVKFYVACIWSQIMPLNSSVYTVAKSSFWNKVEYK